MADPAKPLILQHRRSDAPPVTKGLDRAHLACWTTVGLAAAGMALSPNGLIVPAVTAGLALAGAMRMKVELRAEARRLQELGAKRTFAFTDLPNKTDSTGAPVLRPDRPSWEPEGVRVEVVHDQELIRPVEGNPESKPWYRWKVLEENLWHYQQQEAWLKQNHPDRYRVVRKWWMAGYVLPTLERRHEALEFCLVEEAATPSTGDAGTLTIRCRRRGDPGAEFGAVDQAFLAEVVKDYQYGRYFGVRMALLPQVWTRRLERRPSLHPISYLQSALLDLYPETRPRNDELPDNIRVRLPVFQHVLVGRGVKWEKRHAQRLYEQLGYDMASVSVAPPDGGDPRIMGCAADEIDYLYLEERFLEQHMIIAGATGTGKTRFADPIIVQAIRCGYPVVFIDPKGDRTMLNRFFYEGRRAGRGHKLHLFHFMAPKCPEVSSYNGMYMYDDPSELASRAAAVIERSKDPFWFRVGLSTAKAVTTLSHWVLKILQMTGASVVDGRVELFQRYSDLPPRYIMALALLQVSPNLQPADADAFISEYMAKRRDRAWLDKPEVRDRAKALKALSEGWYNPYVWNPSLRPVNVYGVGAPEILVGWALRVVYAHWWSSELPSDDVAEVQGKEVKSGIAAQPSGKPRMMTALHTLLTDSKPDALAVESILGMSPGKDNNATKKTTAPVNWMTMYRKFRKHPLAARYEDDASAWGDHKALAYIDYFCPRSMFTAEEWRATFEQFDQAFLTMFNKATEDRNEYRKHMATLTASLQRFEGERERIISSVDPDIIIRNVVEQNELCYMLMNYMKDTEAVEGMARVIVCDAMSYLGEVYGTSRTGRKEWYLCCDEVGTFLSQQMVPILSQGRSAGVRTCLLGQNLVDYEVAMGDRNKALQALGNLTFKVQLRTEQKQDADIFVEKTGKTYIDVRGNLSHSINPSYGKSGSSVVDAFSVNSSRGVNEREVPLVSTGALFSLPCGHAFLNGQGSTFLLVQGMLPAPPCNILEEFDILRYDPKKGEEKPPIVDRRKTELAAIRNALRQHLPRSRGSEDEGLDPGIRMVGGVDTRAGHSRETKDGVANKEIDADGQHAGTPSNQGIHDDREREEEERLVASHTRTEEASAVAEARPPSTDSRERRQLPPSHDDGLFIE